MNALQRFCVLFVLSSLVTSLSLAEILPPLGLYDPETMRSTTTGDPYPIFPDGVNQIPPLKSDRLDQVDQALCILIRTPDVAGTFEPENFDSLLFSDGIYPTGSMNDYFMESSYGQFGVDGDVAGWVTAANNYSYYTWGNYGFGSYPHNAQKLAEEAVLGADALGVDFSNYDNDGDGWVDALIIVHQGPGAENTGSANDIWSHRWALHDPILLDGVYVYDYSMDPELAGDGSTAEIEHIGVFSHEYTHLLGMADLYDYDSKLDPNTFTTLGDDNDHPVMDWGIMGYGGYGISSYGRGEHPNHHNAYFKTLLGWVDPIVLGLSQNNVQVPEYEVNPVIYKIPINGSETEYFLIENRNSSCPDAIFDKLDSDFSAWFNWFTPGPNPLDAGLIITHVDETMPLNNGTPSYPHYGCQVVDAGYTAAMPWPNLEFTEWWYPYEFKVGAAWCSDDGQDEFTPLTDPNTDGYTGPSGIYITNISNAGPVMTFDLEFTTGTPDFSFAGSTVLNDDRDHDGFIDHDETGELYIRVRDIGDGEARSVSGTLTSSDPYVNITTSAAAYPDIGITLSAENITPFVLEVASNCPIGYDAEAQLELTWEGGGSASIVIPLELNWDLAFADDMENGVGNWTHGVAYGSYGDQWHLSSMRNHTPGGAFSWKCGADGAGSYANLLNAELAISFAAQEDARVSFWHRMRCEEDWDGGILEKAVGSDWEQIYPLDGYPDQILHTNSGGPFSYGTECFSSDFDWTYTRAVIPNCGSADQIRFRFGSDQGTSEEGWYIDDVKIYYGDGLIGIQDQRSSTLPKEFALLPAFPNPFNASVTLNFTLPRTAQVTLTVFDTQGRDVATLVDGVQSAGKHSVSLSGDRLVSGVYFAVLDSPEQRFVQKILHLK